MILMCGVEQGQPLLYFIFPTKGFMSRCLIKKKKTKTSKQT